MTVKILLEDVWLHRYSNETTSAVEQPCMHYYNNEYMLALGHFVDSFDYNPDMLPNPHLSTTAQEV